MKPEHKLYAAVAAVLALAVAFWVVSGQNKQDAEAHAPGASKELPMVTVSKEDAEKATKLVVKMKDKDEVTLEKKGETWEVTAPTNAAADQAAVTQVIENLQKITVKALIADTPDVHKKYELDEASAVHARAYAGDKVLLDMYFGLRGGRGQMARMGGEGASAAVYLVDGYSSYNWAKDLKAWRDKEMLKFEDGNVIAVEVENKHGKFSFTKDGDAFKGKLYARGDDGELGKAKDVDKFEPNKVKDLLRSYKNLKAVDFAAKDADTGIDAPLEHGGVVRIQLKDEDAPSVIVSVGKTQEGSNRYAVKEGSDTVYVIASWTADWASAEVSKFQKDEKKEPEAGDDAGDDDAPFDMNAIDVPDGAPKDQKPKDAKPKDAKPKDAKAPEKPAAPTK